MKLELDYETADKITLINLEDCLHRNLLELQSYEDGEWMHPEDVAQAYKLIPALKLVINYFGGGLDD
jgi:hypothetical protein